MRRGRGRTLGSVQDRRIWKKVCPGEERGQLLPWEEGPGPPPPPLPGPLAQPQASALATVKASIISELSSKLQQFGGSSAAGGALPWARGGSGGSGDSHHGGASYVPERTSSLQRQR